LEYVAVHHLLVLALGHKGRAGRRRQVMAAGSLVVGNVAAVGNIAQHSADRLRGPRLALRARDTPAVEIPGEPPRAPRPGGIAGEHLPDVAGTGDSLLRLPLAWHQDAAGSLTVAVPGRVLAFKADRCPAHVRPLSRGRFPVRCHA